MHVSMDSSITFTDEDRRIITQEWNETSAPYPEEPLHSLFLKTALRCPRAVGVDFAGSQLTYHELLQSASCLASNIGNNSGSVIGLCVERSLEEIVGMVGIMLAGNAYVPLDPDQPQVICCMRSCACQEQQRCMHMSCSLDVTKSAMQDRLKFIFKECSCTMTATQQKHANISAYCSSGQPVLILEDCTRNAAAGCITHVCDAEMSALAVVMFTSGSTGKPKGVMIEHGSAMAAVHGAQRAVELTYGEGCLLTAKFTFCMSVKLVWMSVLGAARLVLVKPSGLTDFDYLLSLLRTQQIAVTKFTPTIAAHLVRAGDGKLPSTLRWIGIGGEAFPTDLAMNLLRSNSSLRLANTYGPTEGNMTLSLSITCNMSHCLASQGTIFSHWFSPKMTETGPNFAATMPIGSSAWNDRCYVLNKAKEVVPVGVTGEIYLGGVKVARGYINRPDLTQMAFIELIEVPGAGRVYKTGDLGQRTADGGMLFLGREDSQVKVNGQRIELEEVEAAVKTTEGVHNAVVILGSIGKLKQLVAYVEVDEDKIAEIAHETCCKTLPDFMVPALFIPMKTFPLNASAKLDRLKFPTPEDWLTHSQLQLTGQSDTSSSTDDQELQEIIEAIITCILNLTGVQTCEESSFIQVGIDSIASIAFSKQLASRFGVQIPNVMQAARMHKTVRGLALYIQNTKAQENEEIDPTIELLSNCEAFVGIRLMCVTWVYLGHFATRNLPRVPDLGTLFAMFGLIQYMKNREGIKTTMSYYWAQFWNFMPVYWLCIALTLVNDAHFESSEFGRGLMTSEIFAKFGYSQVLPHIR